MKLMSIKGSYTIHFNFNLKEDAAEGRVDATHTRKTHSRPAHDEAVAADVCCMPADWAGKHIIACSHLTRPNSGALRLLKFGFSGFELLEIK